VRIALLAHHARPTGGQDRYVLELARHLSSRHEVHLIVVRAEGLRGEPVAVHALPLRDRPVVWLTPRYARAAIRLARRHSFDIVHAIGGAAPGANVVTAQYCQAEWQVVQQRYRGAEGARLGGWYGRLTMWQALRFERRAYRHPALAAVIAVSDRVGREVCAHHALDPSRVATVYNGVDLDDFARARHPDARAQVRTELRLPPESRLALFVGTYWRKGLDTAIAACAGLSENVHLVVAGAGDGRWARSLAQAAGVGSRVHLVGLRRDVPRLCAAADVFVLPTRYEPFGMVIAEAMATEVPVVVSGCAGAAELIRHGENGYVVERPDDIAAFRAAMQQALADPSAAAAVGRAARASVAKLAWPDITRQTVAVYERVLRGHG